MGDSKSIAGEVEGGYDTVKVQLAGAAPGEKVVRPTRGTQLVWGGTELSSPWGHLAALIEKAGGSVNYTFVHASDFKEIPGVAKVEEEESAPEQTEEKEKDPLKDAPPHPAGEIPHSAGGAEGHGPLFDLGLDFAFDGNTARVWAHPHTFLYGPVPLVIFLHGINGKTRKKYPPLDEKAVHVGKLAGKLIDDGAVTPLVICAPTDFSDSPWGGFDLKRTVDAVAQLLAEQNVKIDYDRVSVVGHSGAGGYRGRGLNRIADQHAQFDGHSLQVFGITDTCTTKDNALQYAAGLKDNKVTAIYSLHKGTGGWAPYDGSQTWAKALGADKKVTEVKEPELQSDVEDYYDNGGATPLRVAIKIKTAGLTAKHKPWKETKGYHAEVGAHNDMVPMWAWYALPRFYPAVEKDKTAGGKEHHQEPPVIEPDPVPAVTGGEWSNVPPGPPVWADAPGVDPKATGAAVFASPASALYWPVRSPKIHEGRAVSYLGTDGKGHGAYKNSAGGRNFLADRPAGDPNPNRFHVGIDLFANFHDIIVACEAGTIIQIKPFYLGVWKVMVKCASGLVINYGEVDATSIKKYGLKVGDPVLPGQPLAEAGRMVKDSMLHFEMYPPGTGDSISYSKDKGAAWLKNYLNPTQYLLALATKGK